MRGGFFGDGLERKRNSYRYGKRRKKMNLTDLTFNSIVLALVGFLAAKIVATWRERRVNRLIGRIAEIKHASTGTASALRKAIKDFLELSLKDIASKLEHISRTLHKIKDAEERERITFLVAQAIGLQRPILMLWFRRKWVAIHTEIAEERGG